MVGLRPDVLQRADLHRNGIRCRTAVPAPRRRPRRTIHANQQALRLFDMTWPEFTALPSRFSAEVLERHEREQLLQTVTRQGYIDHYTGIRISRRGQRFRIENAIVWNLLNPEGSYYGQAAYFAHWHYL